MDGAMLRGIEVVLNNALGDHDRGVYRVSVLHPYPLAIRGYVERLELRDAAVEGPVRASDEVAFPVGRGPSMLVALFLLGIAAGLGALAPSLWRRAKRCASA